MRKNHSRHKRLGALAAIFVSCLFLVGLSNASAELVTAYTFEPGTELKDVAVMLGGSGVAYDDLTCSGTCTLTDGVFGQGIEVGLADYFAALVNSSDLDPGPNGFTVALYTKGTEWGDVAGVHTLTKYFPSNGWDIVTGGLTTGYEPMTIVGTFSNSGSFYRLRVPDETVEGAWRHIAMTYDGMNTAKLYIDGRLRVERNDVAFTSANVGVYGGVASHAPSQADHAYGGFFDDIAIFNEVLTDHDILMLSKKGLEAYMGYASGKDKGHAYGQLKKYQIRLPRTGQTTSYATGDDGSSKVGVMCPEPRFTDNLDGTVTDNCTGLIWLQNANCFGSTVWYAGALMNSNALASGQCGLNDDSIAGDWRLPNVRELHSLIDFSNLTPALPSGHPFTGVQPGVYWTSTSYAEGSAMAGAWGVFLGDGTVYPYTYGYSAYVWPVRGGN